MADSLRNFISAVTIFALSLENTESVEDACEEVIAHFVGGSSGSDQPSNTPRALSPKISPRPPPIATSKLPTPPMPPGSTPTPDKNPAPVVVKHARKKAPEPAAAVLEEILTAAATGAVAESSKPKPKPKSKLVKSDPISIADVEKLISENSVIDFCTRRLTRGANKGFVCGASSTNGKTGFESRCTTCEGMVASSKLEAAAADGEKKRAKKKLESASEPVTGSALFEDMPNISDGDHENTDDAPAKPEPAATIEPNTPIKDEPAKTVATATAPIVEPAAAVAKTPPKVIKFLRKPTPPPPHMHELVDGFFALAKDSEPMVRDGIAILLKRINGVVMMVGKAKWALVKNGESGSIDRFIEPISGEDEPIEFFNHAKSCAIVKYKFGEEDVLDLE